MRFASIFTFILFSICASAQPKHLRVMYNDEPSTTFCIGFSQDLISIENGVSFQLLYADQDYGNDASLYEAVNTPLEITREVTAFMGQNHYFFDVKNLQPKTAYYFIIAYTNLAGQTNYTERYWTKTSSNNPKDPLSIVAGGDSRLNIDEGPIATLESITIRQESNKMVAKLRPDIVAFGGDYTFANTFLEWVQWFTDWELTYTEDGKITPIVAAIGNHEHAPFGCPDCGNQVVYNLFNTPHPDNYYALNFSGNLLRLYTLNTEMAIEGEQTDWLTSDLAQHDLNTYWKMAQYHKPIRPHEAGKTDNNEAFANWAVPFYEKQVRLVIECDAHVVKTTYPVIPTTEGDGEIICEEMVDHNFYKTSNGKGTIYTGEGTWAALREGDDAKEWTKEMGSVNQVKWIWVFEDRMEVRTAITYFSDNANYVNNITGLGESNRFEEPSGIELFGNEKVTTINNNGLTPMPEPCSINNINEFNKAIEYIDINPNPTRNKQFEVQIINIQASKASISILNAEGKEVLNKEVEGELRATISLTSESTGMYFIKAQANGKSYLKRFILN